MLSGLRSRGAALHILDRRDIPRLRVCFSGLFSGTDAHFWVFLLRPMHIFEIFPRPMHIFEIFHRHRSTWPLVIEKIKYMYKESVMIPNKIAMVDLTFFEFLGPIILFAKFPGPSMFFKLHSLYDRSWWKILGGTPRQSYIGVPHPRS